MSEDMLRTILGRLDEQGAENKGINDRLDRMEGDISEIKRDVAQMKEDIKNLKEGQERQDLVLEKLALRSLEQESRIDALKRAKQGENLKLKGYFRKREKTWSFTVDIGRDPVTGKRKQKTVSGFKTKKEAEKACAELIAQIENGG